MEGDKGRDRDRVTGSDLQGMRDRYKEEGDGRGQRQEQGQSDRVRCRGREG